MKTLFASLLIILQLSSINIGENIMLPLNEGDYIEIYSLILPELLPKTKEYDFLSIDMNNEEFYPLSPEGRNLIINKFPTKHKQIFSNSMEELKSKGLCTPNGSLSLPNYKGILLSVIEEEILREDIISLDCSWYSSETSKETHNFLLKKENNKWSIIDS